MLRWLIFLVVFGILDFYAFQSLRTVTKSSWIHVLYWVLSVLVIGNLIYQFYGFSRSNGFSHAHSYAVGFFIAILVPKAILLIAMLGEDIFRVPQALYRYFTEGETAKGNYFASRRKFISQVALGLAAIPSPSILYGISKGKSNYTVLKYTLNFEDLPEAFDGYQITQISDVHSGSFDNVDTVSYAIDLINEQQSGVILFTGDMVNNKAEEMKPYKALFGKLKAKDGLYSVLGNHDYGDYAHWNSEAEKEQNLEDLKTIQKEIGFDLLLN